MHVEDCRTCHGEQLDGSYAGSVHADLGIRCGQCHAGQNHPDFTRPVADGTCGGCHQAQLQQTVASRHFATRVPRSLDGDRAARAALRRDGFVATSAGKRVFAGDPASGDLGGRLCAACHYDEHRLGLDAVRRADACVGCQESREDHYPSPEPANRCVMCHVRAVETVSGQVVNTHRFAAP